MQFVLDKQVEESFFVAICDLILAVSVTEGMWYIVVRQRYKTFHSTLVIQNEVMFIANSCVKIPSYNNVAFIFKCSDEVIECNQSFKATKI